MKVLYIAALALIPAIMSGCASSRQSASKENVEIRLTEPAKKAEVFIDGKLFTALTWPDSIFKPVMYPIINGNGTEITRGYPLNPRAGERIDHPHHVGSWLNYGNVNGIDFWGNSYDIPEETRNKSGGRIVMKKIDSLKVGKLPASFQMVASWQDPSGRELLLETTVFRFSSRGSNRIIDRITTLTATNGDVQMPDTKEGMFAIRVARQLELPSDEEVVLTDASNRPTTIARMTNEGVTGNYRSSEGIEGEAVWSTRAKWMNLYGSIATEKISVVICDHPLNPGYPTYWHARGYGLFAANPLGAKDFTAGKESLNFSIPQGSSATFRYRTIISAGTFLSDKTINILANEFANEP